MTALPGRRELRAARKRRLPAYGAGHRSSSDNAHHPDLPANVDRCSSLACASDYWE